MEILRSDNPISVFQNWLRDAAASEPNDPEAMALATVNADGRPAVRMVLLKGIGADGFRFFTNTESRKADDLRASPYAALCFHWKSLLRQVRVEGRVEKLPRAAAEEYFATRHPQSKLGAWASRQSRPLETRAELESRVVEIAEKFKGQDVPCPPHWGGYILVPEKIEFWQQGDFRLHDRFLFTRKGEGWEMERLNP